MQDTKRITLVLTALAVAGLGCTGPRPDRPAGDAPAAAKLAVDFPAHAWAPLTAAEYARVVELTREYGRLDEGARFAMVALAEPTKDAGPAAPRAAEVVVLDRAAGKTWEGVVSLSEQKVIAWQQRPGVQPLVLIEEWETGAALTRADPTWRAAIRKRGITDFDKVHLEVWASGSLASDPPGRRLLRVLSYLRDGARNPYGRPIEGLVALVDIAAGQVKEVQDTGTVPVPAIQTDPDDLPDALPGRAVTDMANPVPPAGMNIDGQLVRWGPWSFRWSLHPREGLVLHDLSWRGTRPGEPTRRVLYRASVSEMLVPYGDPDPTWNWRNAFDEGEYGLGRLASPLVRGREAPAHALLFGAVFADDSGKPYAVDDVVMIYEHDDGVLWRHADPDPARSVGRRNRRLVVACMVTVGNYDYGLNWILSLDGQIEFRVDLTGILLAKAVADQSCSRCGPEVGQPLTGEDRQRHGKLLASGVLGVNHQHLFNVRLDLDVDGPANSIAEIDLVTLPAGPENPRGNAFVFQETLLASEKSAARDSNPAVHRRWKVFNPAVRNAVGHYTGYVLEGAAEARLAVQPTAAIRERAGFASHNFWASAYHPCQRYAAGPYPNQAPAGQGLPEWIADDQPLVGRDVVVWYTFGVSHGPRPEEWPVMPVARAGFRLIPHGFFDANPALKR